MVRNIFLVAGVVAVIFGVGFLVDRTHSNTVVLTEKGFSPREITVSVGETVTFVNKRDKFFWPASDFHPTHTAYPAFDADEALAPGSSWEFTFTESGLFKYHDHLAPFFFGIVRVEDASGRLADNCIDRGGRLACWQDEVILALADNGLSGAYDTVSALYATEPTFAQSCHFIAHNIGLASYGFYREDPRSVMTPKASVCGSGFYHGFMEAYLGASGDVAEAARVCEEIGSVLKESAPDARLQCYHGIGHGIVELLIAGDGLFGSLDEMVTESLRSCEESSEGEEERFRCASGLFNGIANFYINGEYGLDVTTSNPLDVCSATENDVYAEACYGNMNSVAFWMSDNNFPRAAMLALEHADQKHARIAVEYLATLYAFNQLPTYATEEVIASCRSIGTHSLDCFRGFAHGLLEHGTPGEEYTDSLAFCESDALSETEKDTCYTEALSQLYGWYSPEKVEAICTSVPQELKAYCPN